MPDLSPEPALEVVAGAPADVEGDLLIVPVFEDDPLDDLDGLDAATGGEVGRARTSGEFRPKPNELFVTRAAGVWRTARVALVGAGADAADGEAAARLCTAAAVALRAARQRRVETAAILLRGGVEAPRAAQAVAEGALLGNFDDRRFKSDDAAAPPPVRRCRIVAPAGATADAERAAEVGRTLGDAVNRARELANAPGNLLPPRAFADRARELAADAGVAIEVLDETAIERLGMGLLLGVARGSAEPPRLIVMRHEPAGAPAEPVLGLVGKGVTFDAGGISLKPAAGMEWMRNDMAGGAAVVCAMRAIGALGVPTRVIGVVPAAENMPGGRAIRPGDVLTGAGGTTVEVINTDAEGRLILADALWYARRLGATHLVDVATLTGACVIALGNAASGLFGAPRTWAAAVERAADRAGERVWPLPLYEDYAEQLRSETADLMNVGGREAGACTAAAFLQAFAGDAAWAHLDIAGSAWVEKARPSCPKGATGVMVRTLTALARGREDW